MTSEPITQLSRAALGGLSAYVLTMITTPLIRAAVIKYGWLAKPVEDRWGRRVIARFGGIAMFIGFMATALFWIPITQIPLGLLLGSFLVFALGLADDLHRLPPYTKFVVQILIGCVVILSGIRIDLGGWLWLAIPLSILWLVLIINAFNLLDNMDGLAAGIGALSLVFCAFHAAQAQQWGLVSLAGILCGSCVGFLHFNFPPAKIYMGDSGSHFLGMVLAILALLGSWHHPTQLLSVLAGPSLILAVPIFDTCFVTVQRLSHRQHPFTGGTDHVSHRLAILGLSVRQTVLTLYGLGGFLGLLSVLTTQLKPLPALTSWFVVLITLVLFGRYLARVNVYQLKREPIHLPQTHADSRPTTLIETMLLHKRRLLEIIVDFVLVIGAFVFAHLLRFEGILTNDLQRLIMQSLPIILVIKLSSFMAYGLYRGVWRYLGLMDLITIVKAVTIASVLSSVALLYLWRFEGYSRAVFIIDWLLSLLAIGSSRVVERLMDEWIRAVTAQGIPVVIIGAGDTGVRVLRNLKDPGRPASRIVGFLDDDITKHGTRIHGLSVLGSRQLLPHLIDTLRIREVLVAITDPPGELLQYVQGCCEGRNVSWKVVTAGVTTAIG